MLRKYKISKPLFLEEKANQRFSELTWNEQENGGRVIGGDLGDLWFQGYEIKGNATHLYKPALHTALDLNADDVLSVAWEILMNSYESIGVECVEHY